MKSNRLLTTAIGALLFLSCGKEYSFEGDLSKGSLKQDAAGSCLPSSVAGICKQDSLLNAANYISLQVNITKTGTYFIKSDTVNGYSFFGLGIFSAAGLNNVRVYGRGRPVNPGVNTFTMMYDNSACSIDVTVIGPAIYTLGGAGAACTGVVLAGTYTEGTAMTTANTATINVNVITTGDYNISTTANGITFSKTGTFTTTGPQQVILIASGTPATWGTVTYTVNGSSGSCTFPVTYTFGTQAVYTYTTIIIITWPAPADCFNATVQGTYTAGVPLDATNTVTLNIHVTTPGAYSIITLTNNGYSFSKSGIFTAAGNQTVTLNGSGTPTASGTNAFVPTSPSNSCNFYVTVL